MPVSAGSSLMERCYQTIQSNPATELEIGPHVVSVAVQSSNRGCRMATDEALCSTGMRVESNLVDATFFCWTSWLTFKVSTSVADLIAIAIAAIACFGMHGAFERMHRESGALEQLLAFPPRLQRIPCAHLSRLHVRTKRVCAFNRET